LCSASVITDFPKDFLKKTYREEKNREVKSGE
ncbi:unnamed protein product, partial [marine sediment metagenome]